MKMNAFDTEEDFFIRTEIASRAIINLEKVINTERDILCGLSREFIKVARLELVSMKEQYEYWNIRYDYLKNKNNKSQIIENLRQAGNEGLVVNLISIIESTEKALLIELEDYGNIWIPKSVCKIKGNKVFIFKWWFHTEKGYNDGEPIHLNDWIKNHCD